ncbi:MAG: hypothetical protein M0R18_15695 [Deltaproteobacteria bacterium]|nr:hypothetical protein [Deltaproteobacteria bacterium]
MKKIIFFTLISVLGLGMFAGSMYPKGPGTVFAAEDWKQEFAEVCGKTQNAMEFSTDELRSFIDRCTRLEERLDELNGPQGSERKVYATRLKMCKELYVYTLEFREKEE